MAKKKKYKSEKTKNCGRERLPENELKVGVQTYFPIREINERGGQIVVKEEFKRAFYAMEVINKES